MTHPDLRSAYPDQLEYELGHSKEVIEQNLGVPVDSFSYPYAFPEEDKNFIRFLQDEMQNIGFDYGVSTILGRAGRSDNRFFLPRLPVNSWDDNVAVTREARRRIRLAALVPIAEEVNSSQSDPHAGWNQTHASKGGALIYLQVIVEVVTHS